MKNKHINILFLLFIIIFTIIVLKGLIIPQPGDENVYYYMGKLINEGKIPYKDFFYAHPPLHIYFLTLIYKVFGFNMIILKSIPLISTLISAFLIFRIAKNKFGDEEAILSTLLFLFSYSTIFNSVFSFGIEIATMFLLIGIYFLVNKKNYIISGIFFGLAGVTRLLSLVPIFIIFLVVLLSSKKNFLKLSSAFLIIFLLVNGIFALMLGSDYLTPVYKFHLLKTRDNKENIKEYVDIIKLNWILFLSAALVIFVKDKKQINMFLFTSIIYLLFLFSLKKLFGFYFIMIFPLLALIGGYSITNLFRQLNFSKKSKIFVLIIFFLIFSWNLISDTLFLEKVGFAGFDRGKDLVDFVNSASKGDLLFGDDSITPLLALMTDKKIALNFVDTNNEVFITRIRNINNVLSDLKGKDIIFIIRSKQGISYFDEVKQFLNKNCEFMSQFHDKIEGSYLVYRCG